MGNRLHPALLLIFVIGAYNGLLELSTEAYRCVPYQPHQECELGRYRSTVRSLLGTERAIVTVVESECVFQKEPEIVVLKNSLWNNLFYEKLQLLSAQVEICRIQRAE